MHKTIAVGNIGKDAVIKTLTDGSVINFNVAVNKKTTQNGVEVESTTWYSCGLYRRRDQSMAIAQYLKAGTKVLVEGEPSIRTYLDKDNKTQAALDLRVNSVELLSPKKADDAPAAQPAAVAEPAATATTAAVAAAGLRTLPASSFEMEADPAPAPAAQEATTATAKRPAKKVGAPAGDDDNDLPF